MKRISQLKRTEVFAVVAILIAIVGVLFVFGSKYAGLGSFARAGVYCSPDGTLSDTQPAQSHRSYCIKSNASSTTFAANTTASYSFSIVDDQGATVKDFAVTHTKPMHVIVVRKDLARFQHVHPDFDPVTGVFTLGDLTLPVDGQYRIFADFAPNGAQKDPQGEPLVVTIPEDIVVGNTYIPEFLGTEARVRSFEGYQVTFSTDKNPVSGTETMLTFDLKQNGTPVTNLQEYLGALGHSVVLREGTLDFIHAHPVEDVTAGQNGKLNFMVAFPQPGKYKVFTQFQREGKVATTDFVVSVTQGSGDEQSMPNMEH